MDIIRQNQFALSILSVFAIAGLLFLTLSTALAKLILPAPYASDYAHTTDLAAGDQADGGPSTSLPVVQDNVTMNATAPTAALEETPPLAPLDTPTIASADLLLSPDVALSAPAALTAVGAADIRLAALETGRVADSVRPDLSPAESGLAALELPNLASATLPAPEPVQLILDQQPETLTHAPELPTLFATANQSPDSPRYAALQATPVVWDGVIAQGAAQLPVLSQVFEPTNGQISPPAPRPVGWVQKVDQARFISVTAAIEAPQAEERVVLASVPISDGPQSFANAPLPPVMASVPALPAAPSRPAEALSIPRVGQDVTPSLAVFTSDIMTPSFTPDADQPVLPSQAVLPSPALDENPIAAQITPAALALPMPQEPAVDVPDDQQPVAADVAANLVQRPPARPKNLRKAAVKTQPDPAPAAATPKAAALPSGVGPGSRISVVGVFQTSAESWALLRLGDGRIVKVTRGTNLSTFQVTKISGNKIWIKSGNSVKAMGTGSAFTLR